MEITFETVETVVLREGAKVARAFCPRCDVDVVMSTPEAASFISGISERTIFRLIEVDLLHFKEDGRVLICLESLTAIEKEGDL